MRKKSTGFKDKNGKEICFDDIIIWQKDVLLEVKKSAVGAIVNSFDGNCIVVIRFPISEELAKTVKVFEEKEQI